MKECSLRYNVRESNEQCVCRHMQTGCLQTDLHEDADIGRSP